MTVEEPCRHDKGVEVHQGEVYCFHCGEHLGKAIKKSELKVSPKTEMKKP